MNKIEEIKEGCIYKIFRKIVGYGADIGGAALAGAALGLVPLENIPWYKRIFVGIGAYALAKGAGNFAKDSMQNDMDKTMDGLAEIYPVIEAYTQIQEEDSDPVTDEEVA